MHFNDTAKRRRHLSRMLMLAVVVTLGMEAAFQANAMTLKDRFMNQSGVLPLALGLVLIAVALIMEWNTIVHLKNIENIPLSAIERAHPRLPNIREMIVAVLLSTVFGIFLAQFLLHMFASTYVPNEQGPAEYDAAPAIIVIPESE